MNTESRKLIPSYRYNPYLYSSAITDPRWATRWYSNTDVHSLLNHEPSSNLLIFSSISDNSQQFLEILDTFNQSCVANRSITAVLIPIAINLKVPESLIPCHWVSLVIKKNEENCFVALFADSLGNPIDIFLPIIAQTLKDHNIKTVFDSQASQQKNEYDCGPCTVFNLMSMALSDQVSKDIKEDDIEKQRRKLSEIKWKITFSSDQELFDIATEHLNKIPIVNTSWNSIIKEKEEEDESKAVDGSNSIVLQNETEKVAKEINVFQKENNFIKDLEKISDIFFILQDLEEGNVDLINCLMEVGELVGGENKISYNDHDEECVRNKYGFINRALESKIKSDGIYFEKLYHLKLLLDPTENIFHHRSVDFLVDFFERSKELKEDLLKLKKKVWWILTEHKGLLKKRYNLVLEKCIYKEEMEDVSFMDAIVTLSSSHYRRVLLSRVKSEAMNIETVDFNIREDRYYVSRVLIIIGELIREYLENNEAVKDETRNVFLHFKHVRNCLIHHHSMVVEGFDVEEDVNDFNKSIANVMTNLSDLIIKGKIKERFNYENLNKNIKFIKKLFNKFKHKRPSQSPENIQMSSEETHICSHRRLKEYLFQASRLFIINSKQINKELRKLNRKYQQTLSLIEERKNYPPSLDPINKEAIMNYRKRMSFLMNEDCNLIKGNLEKIQDLSSNDMNKRVEKSNMEGMDKKCETIIIGNLINYIIKASRILKETPLQKEKLSDLDQMYKEQFKLISENLEEYPKGLDKTNEDAINKFIKLLKERKSKSLIISKDTEGKDDLLTVNDKRDFLVERLIRETEYILLLETRHVVNAKKLPYMVEHSVGVIGQLMRDITELESVSQKMETTAIHDSASQSAKSARNQGLVHDIFAFSTPWFKKQIQDNILPAQHHFNAILTISRMNKCKISTVTLFSIALSFMNIGFLDKAVEYFKKTIDYTDNHPEEVIKLKDKNIQIFKKLWNIPEANIFEDLLGINPYSFISRFYLSLSHITARKIEDAFEDLMVMKNMVQVEEVMRSSNRAMMKLVNDLFEKLAYCLLVKNKFPEVVELMKEIMPFSENQFFKHYLANAYRYMNRSEEAYQLFQEILDLDFKPIKKYKLYQLYLRFLTCRPSKEEYFNESMKYIPKMEKLFNDNIGYFKRKYNDGFLLMRALPLRLYTQLLIDKADLAQNKEKSFDSILEELESIIHKFHRIIRPIKHDFKDDVRIESYFYQFCRVFTSVISETNANVSKEQRKLEGAQYFFDKARERTNFFKEKSKLSLCVTNEMIKTANYLAYGYVKMAVRSDQGSDSFGHYINRALPYLNMVKVYMVGYDIWRI